MLCDHMCNLTRGRMVSIVPQYSILVLLLSNRASKKIGGQDNPPPRLFCQPNIDSFAYTCKFMKCGRFNTMHHYFKNQSIVFFNFLHFVVVRSCVFELSLNFESNYLKASSPMKRPMKIVVNYLVYLTV